LGPAEFVLTNPLLEQSCSLESRNGGVVLRGGIDSRDCFEHAGQVTPWSRTLTGVGTGCERVFSIRLEWSTADRGATSCVQELQELCLAGA